MTKTTAIDQVGDVFGELLRALRVRGTLLLRESYCVPFAVNVPSAEVLGGLLAVDADTRVVAFHFAEAGCFELRVRGRQALLVEEGELVLCFGGLAHRLARGGRARVLEFAQLLGEDGGGLYGPAQRESAQSARIVCGAFALQDTLLNPLLASVPELLHLRASAGDARRLEDYTDLLSAELARADASGFIVERLLEVLCAEGFRRCARDHPTQSGWFRALEDDSVRRALGAFHAAPGRPWSVALLARQASLSPSRFGARFRKAAGMSAMRYVSRWRMNLAMRRLRESQIGTAQLAAELGYESLPAFSRAFKKWVGTTPAAYR